MLSFECDYNCGAHPAILEKLIKTNFVPQSGYGFDEYSDSAKEKIKAACNCPDAEIFFLIGGTQSNAVVIDSLLKSYEGVVCTDTGHINTHEAGAIEACGHKVLSLPNHQGKICTNELIDLLKSFYANETFEHMAFPGMVYISHPTEYGTLYSKQELSDISSVCREYKIPLYLDGARLAYGLMSKDTDVTLSDIAELCDVFYIGGTKCGALCGEAVVFTKNNMPKHFLTIVKNHGALLAKGRVTGVQFDALFTDDLYFKIGRYANNLAETLKNGLKDKGYKIFIDSPTNQQFVVLDNKTMEELKSKVSFSYWEVFDENHTVVRFATSWATTKDDIEKLLEIL